MRSNRLPLLPACALVASACAVAPDTERTSSTRAALTMDVATALELTGKARVRITTPKLDLVALDKRWRERFSLPPSCTWRAYAVGDVTDRTPAAGLEVRTAKSITSALKAARLDTGACGAVVMVGPGRWVEPAIEMQKPTVLVGGANVVLSTTLASAAGQPIWLQDLTLDDAPFPGAVFVSHPRSESTLVRVHVQKAMGVGILHDGGTLTMFDSDVQGTRATSTMPADLRVDVTRVRAGFGQPAASRAVASSWPRDPIMDPMLTVIRRDPGFDPYVAGAEVPRDYDPIDVDALITDGCTGAGAILKGAMGNLGSDVYALNDTAGLVVDDTLVKGVWQSAVLNGVLPLDDSSPTTFATSKRCYGGIQLKRNGGLLGDGGGAVANKPVGVAALGASELIVRDFRVELNESWTGAWGDGILGIDKSFLSLSDFDVANSVRAGITLSAASANLYSGAIRDNGKYGLVTLQCAKAYIADGVQFIGNPKNLYDDASCGGFQVSTAPIDVPH